MRTFATVGAVLAGLGVALGAFGTHALRDLVTPERLDTFETAVRYQLYHGLALLALGVGRFEPGRLLTAGGWTLFGGSAIFSTSLYLLVLSDQSWLGAVAPVGGAVMIAGWSVVALAVGRSASSRSARTQTRG